MKFKLSILLAFLLTFSLMIPMVSLAHEGEAHEKGKESVYLEEGSGTSSIEEYERHESSSHGSRTDSGGMGGSPSMTSPHDEYEEGSKGEKEKQKMSSEKAYKEEGSSSKRVH